MWSHLSHVLSSALFLFLFCVFFLATMNTLSRLRNYADQREAAYESVHQWSLCQQPRVCGLNQHFAPYSVEIPNATRWNRRSRHATGLATIFDSREERQTVGDWQQRRLIFCLGGAESHVPLAGAESRPAFARGEKTEWIFAHLFFYYSCYWFPFISEYLITKFLCCSVVALLLLSSWPMYVKRSCGNVFRFSLRGVWLTPGLKERNSALVSSFFFSYL